MSQPQAAAARVAPADRYGRAGADPRRRRLAVALIAAVAVAFVVLVVLIGLQAAREPVRWQNVGFDVQGPAVVEVTYEVIKSPDDWAECTLVALNEGYAQVGVRTVLIGPGEQVQRFRSTVSTAELATTGIVDSCQVVPEP